MVQASTHEFSCDWGWRMSLRSPCRFRQVISRGKRRRRGISRVPIPNALACNEHEFKRVIAHAFEQLTRPSWRKSARHLPEFDSTPSLTVRTTGAQHDV